MPGSIALDPYLDLFVAGFELSISSKYLTLTIALISPLANILLELQIALKKVLKV